MQYQDTGEDEDEEGGVTDIHNNEMVDTEDDDIVEKLLDEFEDLNEAEEELTKNTEKRQRQVEMDKDIKVLNKEMPMQKVLS
eukprot:CAMPEP_0116926200 /NCGR_PEP_ID=MMETSP0467-20121206/24581_1 /TAXON_ID=283647 /ORGANISM="Mesodinium pulex, Strain SPMC105" /LENGTH=81 /DNA_ID=CAMNT_0004605407 /DNA_START=518 /DNA_END=763 /DNA_ORIENTATION=-